MSEGLSVKFGKKVYYQLYGKTFIRKLLKLGILKPHLKNKLLIGLSLYWPFNLQKLSSRILF